MRSLVVDAEGTLQLRRVAIPQIKEYQALVKLRSCGICNGTDMKLIHGVLKNFDSYPAVLGHEGVGEVVKLGSAVSSFKLGDLVLLPFLEEPQDRVCPGWGALSEYAVVGDLAAATATGHGKGTADWNEAYAAQKVIRPTDQVDPTQAAMIVTFREVLSAIKRFGMQANASVVIFGAGPVGLCFTKFCKLLGLGTVVTVDIADDKVAQARQAGADYAFNSKTVDLEAEIRRLFPQGVDYVVDAVGNNALINQAMGLIKYNGKICCYGISPQLNMDLDWSAAPYNWTLQFVQWPLKEEEGLAHAQIMAWINQGALKPADFISDVFNFDHVLDAFALVAQAKSTTKKVVVTF